MLRIQQKLQTKASRVDKALDKLLPNGKTYPKHLAEAMRYSVFSGGKRVRPFLVLESAKLCGGNESSVMPIACAIEMIHAYSLVHDDLPAMDDDDFRRGRKTCHKKYDEATAILTGDALSSLAFQIIAEAKAISQKQVQIIVKTLAEAIGPYGMVAGQAADLEFQKNITPIKTLRRINELKTGALIRASVLAGAIGVGATKSQVKSVREYGEHVGFLFQLVDDILDSDGYVKVIGEKKTYLKAAEVRDRAIQSINRFGKKANTLISFAEYLYGRKN